MVTAERTLHLIGTALFFAACGGGESVSTSQASLDKAMLASSERREASRPTSVDKGGVLVEVLEVGTGRELVSGDEVFLDYTLTCTPKAPEVAAVAVVATEAPKPAEHTATADTPPAEVVANTAPPADASAAETATASTPETSSTSSEVVPPPPPSDPAPTAPEPIVIASTKGLVQPFCAKLGRDGKPALVPGLVRGLEGLHVGSRARITVPAEQAYGNGGNPSAGIPADVPLVFEVHVLGVR
jgi:hypothetical protein